MNFSLLYQLKNNKSQVIDIIFYVTIALLIAVIFSYGIFTFKIHLQNQEISELDKKIAAYSTDEQKASENKVLDYKKKLDDFMTIITNHRISANLFSFIEEHTLPTVWFSSFGVFEDKNEINILGESENMETLSNQVNVFEKSKEYIKNITVLTLQLNDQGKVKFTLRLSLDPKIFTYRRAVAP